MESSQENQSNPKITINLVKDGLELENYISDLAIESKKRNPKTICIDCWCKLTWDQKSIHVHKDNIRTLSVIAQITAFKKIAHENNKISLLEEQTYYQILADKPDKFYQTKKMKLNQEIEKEGQQQKENNPITINLGKNYEFLQKKDFLDEINANEDSNTQLLPKESKAKTSNVK